MIRFTLRNITSLINLLNRSKKIAFDGFIRDIFGQTDTVAIFSNEGRFFGCKVIFRTSYLRNEFGEPPPFFNIIF